MDHWLEQFGREFRTSPLDGGDVTRSACAFGGTRFIGLWPQLFAAKCSRWSLVTFSLLLPCVKQIMTAYLDWEGWLEAWKDGQKCGRYQQVTWILPIHKLMYELMKVICSCKGPKKKRWWGTVFRPITENRGLNWLLVRCHKSKQKTFLYAQQYSLFALRTWFIDWSHTYPWCWGPSHIYQSKRDMFCSRSGWRTLHSKLWNVPAQHLFFKWTVECL